MKIHPRKMKEMFEMDGIDISDVEIAVNLEYVNKKRHIA